MKSFNNSNSKKNKRKGYKSLLLLLLTIALFVTATYAWFTDSAFTKGNKVFSGNMFVDVIVSEDDLVKQMEDHGLNEEQINTILKDANLSKIKYVRKYSNGGQAKLPSLKDKHGVNDTYYRISAMSYDDLKGLFGFVPSAVDIYNIEPGQYRSLTVNYLNNGDLAFKAAGAIKLQYEEDGSLSSHNGLETLNEQYFGNYLTYKNNYQITEPHISTLDQIKRANTIVSSTEANATTISINGVDCKVVAYMDANGKYSYEEGYDNNPVSALMILNDTVDDIPYHDGGVAYYFSNSGFANVIKDSITDGCKLYPISNSNLIEPIRNDVYYVKTTDITEKINDMEDYINDNEPFELDTGVTSDILFAPLSYKLATANFDKFDLDSGESLFLDLIYTVDEDGPGEGEPVSYAATITNSGEDNYIDSDVILYTYFRPTFYVSLVNVNPEIHVTPTEIDVVIDPKSSDVKKEEKDRTYNLIDPKTIYEDTTDSYYSLDNNYLLDENEHITSENYSKYEKYIHDFDKLVKMLHAEKIDEAVEGAIEKRIYTKNDDHYEYDHSEYYKVSESINLEKVLEVYATNDADEILEKGKTSKYYFGTVAQFDYLTTYGPSADKTLSEATEIDDDSDSPDNYYKILKADATANLYADYQRYLACGSGYCLPKDVLTNDGITIKDGVNVKIYSKNVNDTIESKIIEGVKEIGSTDLTVYMPTDVDSRYQNASIELQVGVTATQVGYEADDLGIMLYDGLESTDIENDSKVKKGDVVELDILPSGHGSGDLEGLILDVNDNIAKIAFAPGPYMAYTSPTYGTHINAKNFDVNNELGIYYENSSLFTNANMLMNAISNYNSGFASAVVPASYNQIMYKLAGQKKPLLGFNASVGDKYYYSDSNGLLYELSAVDSHEISDKLEVRAISIEDILNYSSKGTNDAPVTNSDFAEIANELNVDNYFLADGAQYYDSSSDYNDDYIIPCFAYRDGIFGTINSFSSDPNVDSECNCRYVFVINVNLKLYDLANSQEESQSEDNIYLIYDDYSSYPETLENNDIFFVDINDFDINEIKGGTLIFDVSSVNKELYNVLNKANNISKVYFLSNCTSKVEKFDKNFLIDGSTFATYVKDNYLYNYGSDSTVLYLSNYKEESQDESNFSSLFVEEMNGFGPSFEFLSPMINSSSSVGEYLISYYNEYNKLPDVIIFETIKSYNALIKYMQDNITDEKKKKAFNADLNNCNVIIVDGHLVSEAGRNNFITDINSSITRSILLYRDDIELMQNILNSIGQEVTVSYDLFTYIKKLPVGNIPKED